MFILLLYDTILCLVDILAVQSSYNSPNRSKLWGKNSTLNTTHLCHHPITLQRQQSHSYKPGEAFITIIVWSLQSHSLVRGGDIVHEWLVVAIEMIVHLMWSIDNFLLLGRQ